jgi:nucleotide-binding universal stress UspA family protein
MTMSEFIIQNIVVPIDLSETSLNAFDTAVALAKRHGAELHMINVIEPAFDTFHEESTFSSISTLSNSSDVLTALAGAVQHAHNLKPHIIQGEGNAVDTIIKRSLSLQSSVIVMGTHGASGYRDGFVGSTTYGVVKHATCPVLTIPPKRKYTSFKKVLFPVRPVSGALQRYDVLCQFLAPNASMDVLGLAFRSMERQTNVLEKVLDEIKSQLEIDKVKASALWGTGQAIADDVLLFAQQTNPELIVLTSLVDVATKPNFVGPHTQKIIHCAKVPVLNIKKVGVPLLAL